MDDNGPLLLEDNDGELLRFSETTTNGPKNIRVPFNKQNNKHQNP